MAAGEAAVYVAQREMALVAADGSIAVAGSDRATTCHVAILRHAASGTAAVGHIDTGHSDQMSALVDTVRYIDTISIQYLLTMFTQYLLDINTMSTQHLTSKEYLNNKQYLHNI